MIRMIVVGSGGSMTDHDFTGAELEHAADLCRAAHDLTLSEGWRAGPEIGDGLCVGNALAMAAGRPMISREGICDEWLAFVVDEFGGDEELCTAGQIVQHFATTLIGQPLSFQWHDEGTEEEALGLLLDIEKAIRDELG